MSIFSQVSKIAEKFGVGKKQIFVSCSHIDKELVVEFLSVCKNLGINYWCMYDEKGNEINEHGKTFKRPIKENIERSTACVLFLSKDSIASEEVNEELVRISTIKAKNENIEVHPIYIDGLTYSVVKETKIHLPENSDLKVKAKTEIGDLKIFDKTTVSSYINKPCSKDDIEKIAIKIGEPYWKALLTEITNKHNRLKQSYKLCNLMDYCVKKAIVAKNISYDIKTSDEMDDDHNLQELHIISNELTEYDSNVYSCMIIAVNLLGERIANASSPYEPKKRGKNYYYYCDAKYLKKHESVIREQIKSFVEKNKTARKNVIDIIKKEYTKTMCLENYFDTYVKDKTPYDLAKIFNVTAETMEELVSLFESDCSESTLEMDDGLTRIKIPSKFISWLNGGTRQFDEDEEAFKFIEFLKKIFNTIKSDASVNEENKTEFNKKINSLVKLQKLEEWQCHGGAPIGKNQVKYLLDPKEANTGDDKFPKMRKWISEDLESGIDMDIVEQAMSNLHFIPMNENDELLRLCYSFVLYIQKDKNTAAWYTTGTAQNDKLYDNEGVVIVYDFKNDDEVKKLEDILKYITEINPEVKKILSDNNSYLLQ